jgi:hypothetical protein
MAETAFGERLERAVRERAGRAAHTAASRMQGELVRGFEPHRKSGDTQRSIRVDFAGVTATSIEFVAHADTPQAVFTNDGTQPHIIQARNVRFLRFQWPDGPAQLRSRDGFFYFTHVNHPGYRGSGWWDINIARWHDLLAEAFGQ